MLVSKSKEYFPLIIIAFSLFLFSPALTNFFSGDDWFHLNISQISSFKEFLNFFSFSPTPQSAAFYRPLSTQVFFFAFRSLFDLNSLPYFLFVLAVFGFSLYLVYLLAQKVLKNKTQAILALFFYSISVTNFTKIYFLSAFQEIVMVVFILLSILSYLKKPSTKNTLISLLFFILALASKETAVVLPFILLILDWSRGRINSKRILPFIIILLPYLYFRFSYFGTAVGESYIWDFSPKRAINTLFWYTLWSFGAPELLVDYVSSGFRILPRLYTDFPFWSSAILLTIALTLLSFLIVFIKNIKVIDKKFLFAFGVFALGLLPVVFLPWHKFTLELTFPMVGFSLMLARLSLGRVNKLPVIVFILLFFTLNITTNILTYKNHYSVNRAKLARRIYSYFKSTYPEYPQGKYFEFINDTEAYPETWGSSKQIAHAASGSNLFKVLYKDKSIEVYYQDYEAERPKDKERISLSSGRFLE